MHQKVAVITWTIDPENNKRILMRHNRPFNGYLDEWTITFGNVDDSEDITAAAPRELEEEFGISQKDILEIKNLNYNIEYQSDKYGPTKVSFFGAKIKDLDIKIILNEESIGYDWMTLENAKSVFKHEDEVKSLDLI